MGSGQSFKNLKELLANTKRVTYFSLPGLYLLQTRETQFSNFRSKPVPFGSYFTNFNATYLEALENSLLSDTTFYFIFAGGREKISDQITLPSASLFCRHISRIYLF